MDFSDHFAQLSIMLPRQSLIDLLPNAEDMVGKRLSSASSKISADLMLSIARNAQKLNHEESSMLSQQAINLLANTYHVSNYQTAVNGGSQLRQIKFYIRENLNNADLNIRDIAAVHKISTRSLLRLFENESLSLAQYIMHSRLKHALELLRHPDCKMSILEIAYTCGFKNPSHFSRVFKQAFGSSPKDIRHSNR